MLKNKLINLLQENIGTYISGEEIAKRLCVSRAAVWKGIKALKNDGYSISATTNKGYCLSERTDVLSEPYIKRNLNFDCADMKISVLQTVDSTNTYIRNMNGNEQAELYTVIANEQTKGRGRRSRSFYSPLGTGLYFSTLLLPKNYPSHLAINITTIAAVAMCEAIEKISDKKPKIKWVNDIYVDDKKVCGILTEASYEIENSILEYVILGIGVNIYKPINGFPKELQNIAGYIFEEQQGGLKNRLTAEFFNCFMHYYSKLLNGGYIEKYRDYSMVIGKDITICYPDCTKNAKAVGIDEQCHLMVIHEDGSRESLSFGEISLKI